MRTEFVAFPQSSFRKRATPALFERKRFSVSCLRRQVIKYNDKVGPEILSLTRRQAPNIENERENLTMRAIVTEKEVICYGKKLLSDSESSVRNDCRV